MAVSVVTVAERWSSDVLIDGAAGNRGWKEKG